MEDIQNTEQTTPYTLTEDDAKFLAQQIQNISDSLNSIRSMLQFFVVLVILGMILQACSVLGLL